MLIMCAYYCGFWLCIVCVLRRRNTPHVWVSLSVDEYGTVYATIDGTVQGHTYIQKDGGYIDLSLSGPFSLPPTSGPSTIVTADEEAAFAEWLILCSDMHLHIPKRMADQKALMILQLRGAQFNSITSLPGKDWWQGFYKRHPEVGIRKSQPISRQRALLSPFSVEAFYYDLRKQVKDIQPKVSKSQTYPQL